jgi:DNA-binding CsgD family transcriptional regulator
VKTLSPREAEVAQRRIRGEKVTSIAADLGVSGGTISELQARALDKLGVGSLNEAIALVSNLVELFRHGRDGQPMTMPLVVQREDIRALRDACAAMTAVLDRMERRHGDD